MTLALFIIITLATFVVLFAYSLSTSKPQQTHPAPRQPKWIESCQVALLITTGVGFGLTCLTLVVAVIISIS